MFTECVLIVAMAKEQIEPKHHEPIRHKSTDVPLEHTHEEDLGTKWTIAVKPIVPVSVAGVFIQVRDSVSNESGWIEFRGPQTRKVRGDVTGEMIQDISRSLALGRKEIYAGAFHFTIYSQVDFEVKDALAAEIQSLCRLNSAQMPVLNGMPLVELCWLKLELLRQANADAKKHCVQIIYSARDVRRATEQAY